MRFSERHGFASARRLIQIDSMDDGLRNSLWSLLNWHVWTTGFHSQAYGGVVLRLDTNPELTELCRALWFTYFKKPIDTLKYHWTDVLPELRVYFFSCPWHEVYDFLEFVTQNFRFRDWNHFVGLCNALLERELSGYRFVGDKISPVTDETEIAEIDEALMGSSGPVGTHLKRSLELLSDRKSPDYRNSIKESVSGVESMVQEILGEKGTLGQLIKKLEDEINLHGALKSAFSSLYGYTSDAGGIRHALMELPSVTFDDAKFFLVVCSAFINFVQAKNGSIQKP